jgi:ABC-type transport system involved in multi-copper enzyme maturation permease subunit
VKLILIGVRKFATRTATLVSILIAVALLGLEFVGIAISYRAAVSGGTRGGGLDPATFSWFLTFPGAFDAVLSIIFSFGGIIGLIYVATTSGSEWSWGTLKVAVSRGQSRSLYVIATFASISLILLGGLVVMFLVGMVATFVAASIAGLSVGNPFDPAVLPGLLAKLLRTWIALSALTSLAYAVTMVAKSQMAGVGTVIGYFLVSIIGPALLPDFVKEIFKYLPFSISSDAIGLGSPPSAAGATSSAIDPTYALLITVAWLVGLIAVTCFAVERTEITG